MKTCPDCGERVYKLGCVNCNEAAYIEEQRQLNALYGYDDVEEACRGCMGPCGRCHEVTAERMRAARRGED